MKVTMGPDIFLPIGPVLFDAPHIPAGMTGFRWNPLEWDWNPLEWNWNPPE
jgi:hypothetical protein